MTKIIAIVTLFWWNPNTGSIEETTHRFITPAVDISGCERGIRMEAFWNSVEQHVPDVLIGADGSYEIIGKSAECVVWRAV